MLSVKIRTVIHQQSSFWKNAPYEGTHCFVVNTKLKTDENDQ